MNNTLIGTISEKNTIQNIIHDTVKKINHINIIPQNNAVILDTIDVSNINEKLDFNKVYSDYNDFIAEEIRTTHSKVEEDKSDINHMIKLEDLLCEKSVLFSSVINELQQQIERDILISPTQDINEKTEKKINDIIMSLKDFDQKLLFLEKDINNTIFQNINTANIKIHHIQYINKVIVSLPPSHNPEQIKSLSNQRDALVESLNKIIKVNAVQKDGHYKLLLNNEIVLFDNDQKQKLSVITSKSNPHYISIGCENQNSKNPVLKNIEFAISSGPIKSLLRFRREEINNVRNKIGQLTINFAKTINAYHMLGYNKYGEIGTELLKISQPEVITTSLYKRPVSKSVIWADINHAQSSDYRVAFKDNTWIVTRLSDNKIVASTNIQQKNKHELTSLHFDGMIFNIDRTAYEGDSYIIKPYSQTLDKLEVIIDKNSLIESLSRNNPRTTQNNPDSLMNDSLNLDEEYQNFTKSIIYQRRFLEDGLPFKIKLLDILKNKKMSLSSDPDQDYKDLTFQQKCYMANVQVFKIAESILNDIIATYG